MKKKEMGVFEKALNRFLSKNGVFSQPRGIEMLKGIRRNIKKIKKIPALLEMNGNQQGSSHAV